MNILHLEDNARDAELLHAQFTEEWPDCQIETVAQREDFLAQLEKRPDLILSDFNMPGFNGLEALHLARERNPETPFIFLSGTIGEDRAIEALQHGAADYVLKDRPKRLVPAMKRALREAKLARERKAAEEQMLRVQRLENIGMLAAGIAHDFNNVLAPVMMGVPLLRMRHQGESDQKILASIESSAARGAGLVKQILGFAHGVTGEPQLIQPKHLIRELLGVIAQTFPKSIRLEERIAADLWPLKANPTQLHQVLLNLCVNARDAMPQGGVLTVRAANCHLDQAGVAAIPSARPGTYLQIEVADTGTGIPPKVLERIWEPFFTTKEAGHGTGLGLSTVRGIVDDHGGTITVETRLGQGTLFRVWLPALPDAEGVENNGTTVAVPHGRGEPIVVVDDDVSVRDVVSAALTGHGYKVLAAADGTEALALLAPRNLEVRAVVTDLDMPHLDGVALVRVVRTLNPAIRILAVSGSAEAGQLRRPPPEAGSFLAKPFTADTLLKAMHELLHETGTAVGVEGSAPDARY
jgi:signal transduction histidine kinase